MSGARGGGLAAVGRLCAGQSGGDGERCDDQGGGAGEAEPRASSRAMLLEVSDQTWLVVFIDVEDIGLGTFFGLEHFGRGRRCRCRWGRRLSRRLRRRWRCSRRWRAGYRGAGVCAVAFC